jgi:hypothetical protein
MDEKSMTVRLDDGTIATANAYLVTEEGHMKGWWSINVRFHYPAAYKHDDDYFPSHSYAQYLKGGLQSALKWADLMVKSGKYPLPPAGTKADGPAKPK